MLTGYPPEDVEGKNCRFLQGPKTVQADVLRIKEAIKRERDCNVHLLNHKKDGTVFVNKFFLTPLKTPEQDVAYFVGIQTDAREDGSIAGDQPRAPGADPEDPGSKCGGSRSASGADPKDLGSNCGIRGADSDGPGIRGADPEDPGLNCGIRGAESECPGPSSSSSAPDTAACAGTGARSAVGASAG